MKISPLSDAQLLELLNDMETDRVERKESFSGDAPQKCREAVCAFANDLPNHGPEKPGVIFIGVKDKGGFSGVDITDQLLRNLSEMKTDGQTLPPPTIIVESRVLEGRHLAVVTVFPADAPPVSYKGRTWIRIGPRRGIASRQDERVLNEKRRYRDKNFDVHPIHGCPPSELSRPIFENEYLPRAVAADILEANGRTYEERLASLGMIASVEDPTPTVVGILTIGKSPRTWISCAYIEFLRIRGSSWGDPVVDEQEIDGNLETMLRRLDEKLKATLSVSVDFTSGESREIRTSPYPFSALQQLTRNAVLHRTYENTNAPVRIYWFDDRIEIHSPGGAYGIVSAENFGNPGASDYRNPAIAAVLKNLGYVQRFGFGIAEARKAMQANGNPPPEFTVETNTVLATLRKAQ
jgi:ATP-dependent DNA helicase RecG